MSSVAPYLIGLETGDKPKYIVICDLIRQRIIDHHLKPGERLPASRNLAVEVGVSRTSIVSAYEQLKAEGYLHSRVGDGYYVSSVGHLDLPTAADKQFSTESAEEHPDVAYSHHSLADMRLFPYRTWGRCVAKVARQKPEALINVDSAFGDKLLRKAIAQYLFDWRGLKCNPAQILITAGSIDGLELCVRTLVGVGEQVGLEDPGYLPLRRYIARLGIQPRWMQIDGQGARVPENNPPRLAIITPSHQFPLGGTMSPKRRTEFINWAHKNQSWILEDDYDSEFRFSGTPIPALTGMDHLNRSIYIGSFAKIFSTGLRLGFLVLPELLIDPFRESLNLFSTKSSISMQRPLADFIQSGEFYRHLRRVRRIYSERRKVLLDQIDQHLHHWIDYEDWQAGMQLLVNLKFEISDAEITGRLRERGIQITPLSKYYSDKTDKSGLLLGFCAYQPEEITHQVALIRQTFEELVG